MQNLLMNASGHNRFVFTLNDLINDEKLSDTRRFVDQYLVHGTI